MGQLSHDQRQSIDKAIHEVYGPTGTLSDDDRYEMLTDDDDVYRLAIKYGWVEKKS